jgi:ABC-type multidrug transport system ATPase subunit
MSDVRLEVKNVSTSFGKFSISDVTFELKSGDVFGLVGNSGSGKSTLIKNTCWFKEERFR